MPYFGEPVGRVKIQTTSKNSQRYYTTKTSNKRFIIQHAKLVCSCERIFVDIYSQGMRDRSMRSGTELAREIKLTDWLMAGKPV